MFDKRLDIYKQQVFKAQFIDQGNEKGVCNLWRAGELYGKRNQPGVLHYLRHGLL